MRISAVNFIIGVIKLIAGIFLAISASSIATWQPKSEILATEKPTQVSASWKSQSKSLKDRVITVDYCARAGCKQQLKTRNWRVKENV